MRKLSLVKLLLEAGMGEVLVGPDGTSDPYRYKRLPDGWYAKRDNLNWVKISPKKFASSIEKLDKAFPDLATSKIPPTETQKSVTAAPRSGPASGIESKIFPGTYLSLRQVQDLEKVAAGEIDTLRPSTFEGTPTSNQYAALYATQFILDMPRQSVFSRELEARVKKFQDSVASLKHKDAESWTAFGDSDTYGAVDAETAAELINRSPASLKLLGRLATLPKPKIYKINTEETEDPGLFILEKLKDKVLQDAESAAPGTKIGKLRLDLEQLRQGNTVKAGLCTEYWCAAYVIKFFKTPGFQTDSGDAWMQHSNTAIAQGRMKFSSFTDLSSEEIGLVTKAFKYAHRGYNNAARALVGKLVPDQDAIKESLQPGDIVGIYNPTSGFFATAIRAAGAGRFIDPATGESSTDELQPNIDWQPDKLLQNGTGFGMNTHLGLIGGTLDGTPLVFHNIHNELYVTPVTKKSDFPVLWAMEPVIKEI